MLKLDEVLMRLMPEGHEAVPSATMATVLALARLIEPSSERHFAEACYRSTALEDLFALVALGELFALDYGRLLYGVTSVHRAPPRPTR